VASRDQSQRGLFVLVAGLRMPGHGEFTRAIFAVRNVPGNRRPLHVDVENTEEDRDAPARPTHEGGLVHLPNVDDLPVAGRNNHVLSGRDCTLGIPEEVEDEGCQDGQYTRRTHRPGSLPEAGHGGPCERSEDHASEHERVSLSGKAHSQATRSAEVESHRAPIRSGAGRSPGTAPSSRARRDRADPAAAATCPSR